MFGKCSSQCTNTNTTRHCGFRQKCLWEGKDVKEWGAESCTISMLKGGCFSWTPWGWATEWRMGVGFIKPLHMQENNQPTSTPWLTWGKTHKSFLDVPRSSWDLKSSGILREGKCTKSSSTSRSCILLGYRQLWPLSQPPPPPPQRQTNNL